MSDWTNSFMAVALIFFSENSIFKNFEKNWIDSREFWKVNKFICKYSFF